MTMKVGLVISIFSKQYYITTIGFLLFIDVELLPGCHSEARPKNLLMAIYRVKESEWQNLKDTCMNTNRGGF